MRYLYNLSCGTEFRRRLKGGNRGFSLTELAIVLGVFSVIVSALWGVASSVRENVKREQMAEQIMITVKNIRSLYQGQANIAGSVTNNLITHNALPNDMVRLPLTSPAVADHPWDQSFAGGSFVVSSTSSNAACNGSLGQYFCLRLNNLNKASCMSVVTSISGSSGPPGLVGIIVGVTPSPSIPVQVVFAQNNCVSPATIQLIYRLRQQEN